MRALIFGVTGQDGAYLARNLLCKGYDVVGVTRGIRKATLRNLHILGIRDKIKIIQGKIDSINEIVGIYKSSQPSVIFNLAGVSSVGSSLANPDEAFASIVNTTYSQLEALRMCNQNIKYFFASSGECFGETSSSGASEDSRFDPRNPYALAKCSASELVKLYRSSFGIRACVGYLYNHESILRPHNFVTMKVIRSAHAIFNGSKENLKLGDLDVIRDWGLVEEYVDAMRVILEQEASEDFIISTGVSLSLGDFVKTVFEEYRLQFENHIEFSPIFKRQGESRLSKGNPNKLHLTTGWSALTKGFDVPRRLVEDFGYYNKSSEAFRQLEF